MPTDTPIKPKPPGKLTPAEQRRRFLAAALESGASEQDAEIAMRAAEEGLTALEGALKAVERPKGKLGAEKLTPEEPRPKPPGKKVEPLTPAEQRRRFEELSRELGTDNGETLDRVFGKIVPPKTPKAN